MQATRKKRFIAITEEICRRTDLTPTDKFVLGRIASFDVYFESAAACAEILGVAEQTVCKAKQKLEKKGFIECIENNGRGKKYIAKDNWKVAPKKNSCTPQAPISKPSQRLKPCKTEMKKPKSWDRWKEKNKDLIPILDEAVNYLNRHKIPLTDPKALRRSITAVADLYRDPDVPDAHVYLLHTYLEYLESPEYLNQLEHTKYCPNITTQYDLFGKFQAVRNFKHDTRRHYDPTKTLTR